MATALLLAAGLAAVTAPSGLLAAAAVPALEADTSAVAPVYQTPETPQAPEAPPASTSPDSSTGSVYGDDSQNGSGPQTPPGGAAPGTGNGSIRPIEWADTTAPQLSGFTPADGSVIGPAATFGASFYDPEPSDGIAPGSVMIHIGGAHQPGCVITASSISCAVSGLADGPYPKKEVKAYACDIHYQCGTATWYVTVDSTAPAISGNQPTGTINTTAATVSAAFSDNISGVDPATAVVTLDGASASGCSASATGISCPATGLSEGPHSVSMAVNDLVGNHSTHNWNFIVDTTAIGVTGQSPAEGSWQMNPSPTISVDFVKTGTGDIDPSGVALFIDGIDVSASADCQSTGVSYTPLTPHLEDGWHTISVTVQDNAGHDGSSSWSFGIDSTAPAITGTSPTGSADAKPTIAAAFSDVGSGIDLQSLAFTLDGQDATNVTKITADSISFVPVMALASGSHNVQLSVGDTAGNQQTAAWSFKTTPAPQTSTPTPAPVSFPASVSTATAGTQPTLVEYWLSGGSAAIIGGGGSWSLTGFQVSANAYYLPWYESGEETGHEPDEIFIKNQGAGEAIVNIFVAGERRWEGKVPEGGSETVRMSNVIGGPVKIICPSGQSLEVTQRLKNPDGALEIMPAVAEDALESELLLPRYEAPAAGQGSSLMTIANAGQQEAAVDVYIGDPGIPESLKGHYTIAANAASRSDMPDVSGGPVHIIATNGQPLVASIETRHPGNGQDIRTEIPATGLTRLETIFVIERETAQSGSNQFTKLFIANPNDSDLEVELKIAGEMVSDPAEPDSELPVISRQSLRMIDLTGLPGGRIEIDCTGCNLGEGLLTELSR